MISLEYHCTNPRLKVSYYILRRPPVSTPHNIMIADSIPSCTLPSSTIPSCTLPSSSNIIGAGILPITPSKNILKNTTVSNKVQRDDNIFLEPPKVTPLVFEDIQSSFGMSANLHEDSQMTRANKNIMDTVQAMTKEREHMDQSKQL